MALDPHLDYRSLLLHFDGSNGSTTFTDNSSHAHACTAVGNAQLTTANSVFGGASLLLDGSGDAVTVAYSSALNLAGGDWTVQGRARATSDTGEWGLAEFGGVDGLTGVLIYRGAGTRRLIVIDWATGGTLAQTPLDSIPAAGNWYAWAVTLAGTTLRIFINGTLSATATGITVSATAAEPVSFGQMAGGGGQWNGQLDEIRVLKGVAAYTASYTPETSAFDDGIGGYVRAPSVLADPALLGRQDVSGLVSAATPLGAPASLANVTVAGMAADPGPLRQPAMRSVLVSATVAVDSVLQQPQLLSQATLCRVEVPAILAAPLAVAHHDFSGLLDPAAWPTYVMDLNTPSGPVRVPISSWQATSTTTDQCYSQCVIPAVTPWVSTLEVATDFVVYRVTRTLAGDEYRAPVVFAPTQTVTFDQGPRRHTATVSGYTDPYPAYDAPPLAARALEGLRLRSSVNGRLRVQCSIDWILRPGHLASVDGEEIEVAYINYYCTDGSEYMMVGEA